MPVVRRKITGPLSSNKPESATETGVLARTGYLATGGTRGTGLLAGQRQSKQTMTQLKKRMQ